MAEPDIELATSSAASHADGSKLNGCLAETLSQKTFRASRAPSLPPCE